MAPSRCRCCDWEEQVVETTGPGPRAAGAATAAKLNSLADPAGDIYHAMVLVGCATMSNRNGFPGVVLGLSGGIDSAL